MVCWDVDGNYYWELGSIIFEEVGGGEVQCEDNSLDVYHRSLVSSLLCAGELFCVESCFGLDKGAFTKTLVHHRVVEFVIDWFLILELFGVDWDMLSVF